VDIPRVQIEPGFDGQPMALWLPAASDEHSHYWHRVSPVPQTDFIVEPGIHAAAAILVEARQPTSGLLKRLWQRFQAPPLGRAWVLPNGAAAEQYGELRGDLLLVWSEPSGLSLDADWIRKRWPECQELHRLGPRLYLLEGVSPPTIAVDANPEEDCPTRRAENLLAAAQQSRDGIRLVPALTDLGIIRLNSADTASAIALLEQALQLACVVNNSVQIGDVLGNLGFALLVAGQLDRAQTLFQEELARARTVGDRFAEKAALEHAAFAAVRRRQPAEAAALFQEALTLARMAGDNKAEADLLWHLAIQHAELGRGREALNHAQAAVNVLQSAQHPHAAWFAEHMERYRTDAGTSLDFSNPFNRGSSEAFRYGSSSATFGIAAPEAMPTSIPSSSPTRWLRMAFTAVQALATFVKSGCALTPRPELQRRLRTCAACPHYTGVRCRLCGCFTNVKARLAQEKCPIGKW
jgi:tetratricopeptide (TPR) repeat protein